MKRLLDALEELFSHHRDNFDRQLYTPIGLCIGATLEKVSTLLGDVGPQRIMSEAEVRFAIADPIIEMVCNCWGYQVTK